MHAELRGLLQKQRNLSDYEGDLISDPTLASCMDEAGKLQAHTEKWLRDNHSDLLADA